MLSACLFPSPGAPCLELLADDLPGSLLARASGPALDDRPERADGYEPARREPADQKLRLAGESIAPALQGSLVRIRARLASPTSPSSE